MCVGFGSLLFVYFVVFSTYAPIRFRRMSIHINRTASFSLDLHTTQPPSSATQPPPSATQPPRPPATQPPSSATQPPRPPDAILESVKECPNKLTIKSNLPLNERNIHLKDGSNLCDAFQGRQINSDSSQCVYRHPNTVHYIKFSKENWTNQLTFREYVSILSVDKFYKPDEIIIHSNNVTIDGSFWERALRTISTPIKIRYTKRISAIGNRRQKPRFITHEADYIKLKIAISEGGIFMDFDAVILNGTRFREMQRKAECVLGVDNDQCTLVCLGFFSSVPNSTFIREWLNTSYEMNYKPKLWGYNAAYVSSDILRDCPHCYSVYIDPYISNWPVAQNGKWLIPGGVDWATKTVAHYMNAGFMKPLKPPHELLRMNTPFTDMIKYVLGDTYKEFL